MLLYIGYTNCRDVCPAALVAMAQVVRNVRGEGKDVQGIFISVDPARDTAALLRAYVTAFDPSFVGLRGTPEQIAQLVSVLKSLTAWPRQRSVQRPTGTSARSLGNELLTAIFILDREARPRVYMDAAKRSVEAMTHDVRLLLEE